MVFNLIFHVLWYSIKGIYFLTYWWQETSSTSNNSAGISDSDRNNNHQVIRGQTTTTTATNTTTNTTDVPNSTSTNTSNTSNTSNTMRIAVRQRPQHIKVSRLFGTFALTFTLVHHLVHTILEPPSTTGSSRTTIIGKDNPNHRHHANYHLVAEAKTCVETDTNNFFCTDDPSEARKRGRKTPQYYLETFGVQQTIEGSGEENRRMREVADGMVEYFKKWIETYDRVESLKEKCINQHDKCVFWASIGECTKNPGYMENECILACQMCSKLLQTPDKENESS